MVKLIPQEESIVDGIKKRFSFTGIEEQDGNSLISQDGIKRRLSSKGVEDVCREGWVEKKSAHLGVWRRRWAVLTSKSMSFYKQEGFITPTEEVDLSKCRAVLQSPRRSRSNCFHLQAVNEDGSHKDVFVSAGSDIEMQEWLRQMPMHVEIVKEGWVAKQRRTFSSFHEPRWCVLAKTKLCFFKVQTLDFRTSDETVDISEIQTCVPHQTDPASFWICLNSQSKSFCLTVGSAVEVQEWLDCLKQECAFTASFLGKAAPRLSCFSEAGVLASTIASEGGSLSLASASSRRVSKERPPARCEPAPSQERTALFTFCMMLALVVYIISPFDVLPDKMPIIGRVDDAIATSLLLYLLIAPLRPIIEAARARLAKYGSLRQEDRRLFRGKGVTLSELRKDLAFLTEEQLLARWDGLQKVHNYASPDAPID